MLEGFPIEIVSEASVTLGIALAKGHLLPSSYPRLLAERGDEHGMEVQEWHNDRLMHLLCHQQGSLLQGRTQHRPSLLGDLSDRQQIIFTGPSFKDGEARKQRALLFTQAA